MKGRLFLVFLIASVSCDYQAISDEEGPQPLSVVVAAQASACPGGKDSNPFDEIVRLRLDVSEPDEDSRVVASKEVAVEGGNASITVKVRTGNDYTLTLYGYSPNDGSVPSWYGRKRGVDVRQGADNPPVEMLLTRYGGFVCPTAHPDLKERAFPIVVPFGDRKVLIAGGFTRAAATGAAGETFILDTPSTLAFVYDGATGKIIQTQTPMTEGRAAGSGIYVATEPGKVLIFGGARQMTVKLRGDFSLTINPEDALDTYEVFDVATMSFEQPKEGENRKMSVARVWPALAPLSENGVLIGGSYGLPPTQGSPDPRRCDLWLPEVGIMDRGAASDTMNSEHFAPAIAPLDTLEGRLRAVFFGGTSDASSIVEVYTEPSSKEQAGSFTRLTGAFDKPPFFSSLIPIRSPTTSTEGELEPMRFLAIGGVVKDGSRFSTTDVAYIVTIGRKPGALSLLSLEKVKTPCAQRYFHAAVSSFRPGRAIIFGGFTGKAQDPGGLMCFFDITKHTPNQATAFSQPVAGDPAYSGRGAMGFVRLEDDTILLVSGMDTMGPALRGDKEALMAVFTPRF